jgi:hypothetical protein
MILFRLILYSFLRQNALFKAVRIAVAARSRNRYQNVTISYLFHTISIIENHRKI